MYFHFVYMALLAFFHIMLTFLLLFLYYPISDVLPDLFSSCFVEQFSCLFFSPLPSIIIEWAEKLEWEEFSFDVKGL